MMGARPNATKSRSLATVPQFLRHRIGDKWIDGDPTVVSHDPADPGSVIAEAPTADLDLVTGAVTAAKNAAPAWQAIGASERGLVLQTAASLVRDRSENLARLLTLEQGKPLAEARGEVARTAAILAFHAAQAHQPTGERYAATAAGQEIETVRTPVGTVAVISPWNFPLAIPAWKIAPGLVHGNTVVWKPSSRTPAIADALASILLEAGVIDGALNVLHGPGRIGSELAGAADVDAISFTGSEFVGRELWRRAAPGGPRVQLELGGCSPAVILADADLDRAIRDVVYAAMGSSGQKCTATRRVIVEESVASDVFEALAERIGSLTVGHGLEPETAVGPLISTSAQDEVRIQIARAVEQGAEIVVGSGDCFDAGDARVKGHFVRPTLLSGLPSNAPVLQEEIFGPVLCTQVVSGPDEALRVANNSRYGLSGSVHTRSAGLARRFSHSMQVGMVHVNNPSTGADAHVPFGGVKASSGPGPREQGGTARDFYTEMKTVYVNW